MFVRLIQGEVVDPEGLRRSWESGHDPAVGQADGWIGSTAGVTGAGQWLAAIRYSSEAAARGNEGRREYGEWWSGLEACLRGRAAVEGSGDVHTVAGGGSSEARFVQFMRARVRDRRQLEAVEEAIGARFAEHRPDFLGGLRVWRDSQRLTVVDWFTSEADARAGERREIPDALRQQFGRWMALLDDVEWYDLADPWTV